MIFRGERLPGDRRKTQSFKVGAGLEAEETVQPQSTATYATNTDSVRPASSFELHERPVMTALPLVHTEEVTPAPAGLDT